MAKRFISLKNRFHTSERAQSNQNKEKQETFCFGVLKVSSPFLLHRKYRCLVGILTVLFNEITLANKGRFCNTIASVALVHTSIQSD